jgi:peptidyl-prolyl cis-trans isomerase SurA
MKGLKKYERRSMPSGFIYTFANKGATNKEFADYVEKRGSIMVTRDSVAFINQTIETKVSDQLINYENSLLEKKNPEFRYLMNEFHDGLLLFEISGRKVWNKVNQDTAGLRKFYEANKNNYLTKQGIYAKLYTLRTQDGEKELASAWKKYSGKSERDNLLLKKFNRRHDSLLVISGQKWFKGDDAQIDGIKWEKGSQTLNRNGLPSIIEISDLIEPVPLSFESVKGDIITAYQKYLEAEWIGQLKKKYNVNIDNSVLVEVKKKLEHE